MYTVNSLSRVFAGRQGETGLRSVVIDCSPWTSRHAGLSFALLAIRPGEDEVYIPAGVTVENGILTWVPDATDTAIAGTGLLAIQGTDTNENVIKSARAPYVVESSLDADGGYTPSPVEESWLAHAEAKLAEMIGEVEDAADEAVADMQEAAAAAVEDMQEAATAAIDELKDTAVETVESWISENMSQQAGYVVDKTLLVEDAAADAKAVGEAIKTQLFDSDAADVDLDLTDVDGNVIMRLAGGHIKTKNFDSAETSGATDVMVADDDADLDITDSRGAVIARFAGGHIKTKGFDSADVAEVIEDVEALSDAVEALQTDVEELQETTKDSVVNRTRDAIDGVYAACKWHLPNNTGKQFCLLMGGDIHSDATRMANMVELLNSCDAFDAGIMLGDIVANTWAHDATYYTSTISNTEKPFLTVIGNHDAGNGNTPATSYTNIADLWAKFIEPNIGYADLASGEYTSGNTYYYKDFADYGIRLIVLNPYEYPTDLDGDHFLYVRGNNCFSQGQVTWFINTLAATPADYGVICAIHFGPCRLQFDRESELTSSTMELNTYNVPTMLTESDATMMAEIVDAWISGSALSKSYAYSVSGSWTGVSVSADFTSRGPGEFITWIGGHLHQSLAGYIYGYENQKFYLVNATAMTAQAGDTPRRAGTRSEDALTALAVDRDRKTVKLFFIGARFRMDGKIRQYDEYSYGGGGE